MRRCDEREKRRQDAEDEEGLVDGATGAAATDGGDAPEAVSAGCSASDVNATNPPWPFCCMKAAPGFSP